MLKMFINLQSVKYANGPTEFIVGSHKTSPYRRVSMHQYRKVILNESRLEKLRLKLNPSVINSSGDIGDLMIIDTSGIHRGVLCQSDRYVANLCLLPYDCGKNIPCHVQ